MTMQADPTTTDLKPSMTRSATTNGRRLIDGVDGRSVEARRFKDLTAAFEADLGRLGGPTTAERMAIRNAAGLVVRMEQLQGGVLRGEPVNPSDLVRLSEAVTAALESLPPPGP